MAGSKRSPFIVEWDEVFPPKHDDNSDIAGDGYGSDHTWKKTYTRQGVNASNQKFSNYVCKDCDVKFTHYYDLQPNIFKAMEMNRIPQMCFAKK